jgi:hypothetical protein
MPRQVCWHSIVMQTYPSAQQSRFDYDLIVRGLSMNALGKSVRIHMPDRKLWLGDTEPVIQLHGDPAPKL